MSTQDIANATGTYRVNAYRSWKLQDVAYTAGIIGDADKFVLVTANATFENAKWTKPSSYAALETAFAKAAAKDADTNVVAYVRFGHEFAAVASRLSATLAAAYQAKKDADNDSISSPTVAAVTTKQTKAAGTIKAASTAAREPKANAKTAAKATPVGCHPHQWETATLRAYGCQAWEGAEVHSIANAEVASMIDKDGYPANDQGERLFPYVTVPARGGILTLETKAEKTARRAAKRGDATPAVKAAAKTVATKAAKAATPAKASGSDFAARMAAAKAAKAAERQAAAATPATPAKATKAAKAATPAKATNLPSWVAAALRADDI